MVNRWKISFLNLHQRRKNNACNMEKRIKILFSDGDRMAFYCSNTGTVWPLFYVYNMYYGSTDISSTLSAVTFLFLVTVPILTMRTLAEERKNKTDQLILTSPVSVEKWFWQISRHRNRIYHQCSGYVSGTVNYVSIWKRCFCKELCGSTGFLVIWYDLYCHWNLCIFTDRKYCNFCSINLCISLCGISDDRNYQSDFTEWKYYYKDFRLL